MGEANQPSEVRNVEPGLHESDAVAVVAAVAPRADEGVATAMPACPAAPVTAPEVAAPGSPRGAGVGAASVPAIRSETVASWPPPAADPP